jgi:stage II sporulation protein P
MNHRYRRFMTLNLARPRTRRILVFLFLAIAVLFSFVGAWVMVQAENSMQGSDFSRVTSRISAKTLAMVMGENIPYFQEEIGSAGLDGIVSRMTFELLTSMNLQDPRTFLGRELPMYALFDSEIDVASADVDYTSIPIESAPPPELEKEIIKAMEKPDQDRASTTQSGIKQKKVLIYSTHFWESYLPELGEKNPQKASHIEKNITLVSQHLAQVLEKMGIGAVTAERKYTWDSGAYKQSRKMVQSVMGQHEGITYLIDLHRDAQRRDKTTKTYNGKSYARLAFVVGKSSKHFEQNLKLARELHKEINKQYPGLSRAVIIKERTNGNNGEYNQSLSPNSMLVEVGGVDNTFEEAYRSVEVLAEVLAQRIHDATPVMRQEGS